MPNRLSVPSVPLLVLVLALIAEALVAPGAPAMAAEAGAGFDVHDLVTLRRVSSPVPSPDGSRIVFVLRTTDLEADRGRTDLWMVDADGSALRRLTTDEASDSSPVWAPDGSVVYFLSSRSGSSQVWAIAPGGGEARQVTDLPLDVANLVLAPDGSKMAFSLDVFPDCDTVRCTADRLTGAEEEAASGRIYDQLFVRHWDTWEDGRLTRLFVLPVSGEGEPVAVTKGLRAHVPSRPFGGPEEIAFTPDGRSLVVTARLADASEPWSTDFDLYLVPVDGSAAPRVLTEDNPAWDTQPLFSPDGATLAYLAMERPGFEADRLHIVLRGWPDGERRVLAPGWDRSVSSMVFSPDGTSLYATAADLGQVSLFRIDVASGAVERLVGEGHVRSPAVLGPEGERLVFGRDTLVAPVDLYTVARDGSDLRRLTAVNDAALEGVGLGEPEQFTFAGAGGDTVHGYLVRPAEFDPAERYPVAFLIHGGPQGSFGNDFHYRWNPQTYAGAGYAVVMIDFHGSVGYGQAFTDSISRDWGGKPLEDLQKGLAAAVERFPFLDGERVCALGASYGGYMVNWVAGRWPDGFRCLVNHDGVFDTRAMYYTTEELWFPEWEFAGPYYENPELHERWNPVNHVDRWTTPMLVIHGSLDYRVPLGQGLGAFTALQRQGIPSRFLHFPDENHWVLSPANSVLWHDTVLDWLDRWLRPDGRQSEE